MIESRMIILNSDTPLMQEEYVTLNIENEIVKSAKNQDLMSLRDFLEDDIWAEFSISSTSYSLIDYIIVDSSAEEVASFIEKNLTLSNFSNII